MPTPPDRAARATLEAQFPLLARTRYAIRAGPDFRYNCIAWAMGRTDQWWWPKRPAFWPTKSRAVSVDAFVEAFATQGLQPCTDPAAEPGFTKVALYVADGGPTHVARIESAKTWSSKLDAAEVLEHEPHALNGSTYGSPAFYFRKKI